MPPRHASSLLPDQLEKGRYWLIQPMLEARLPEESHFKPVNLAEEFSDTFSILRNDRQIKKLAAVTTYGTLATRLMEAFRKKGAPKPEHNPYMFDHRPLTEEGEHHWRQAQVIQALIDPVLGLRAIEAQSRRVSQRDAAVRRYHPHVECYRKHIEPLLDTLGGSELLSPDLLFDHPHLDKYYQAAGDAFTRFQEDKVSQAFKKKLEAHRRRLYNSKRSVNEYVDALINAHPGVCVIYLGLGHDVRAGHASLSDVKQDFAKFLQKATIRTFADQQVGYLWKLSHSLLRGYHHHCFFFFQPEEAQYWDILTDCLCALWSDDITAGKGVAYQPYYRQTTINNALLLAEHPAIHRKGDDTYLRLMAMLEPLVHIDDVTYLELPKGVRSLGRGQLPKPR
nr:hypothetical protein [uncultured Halomonas sp.]